MPMILPAAAGVGGSILGKVASSLPLVGSAISGLGSFFGGDSGGGIKPIQAQRLQRAALRSGRNQAKAQYRRELRETRRQLRQSFRDQKYFARHSIRMRVEDAKKAGLHPLFALSGGLPGFSPAVSIPSVSTPSDPGTWFGSEGGSSGPDFGALGSSLTAMGQHLMPGALEDPLDKAARLMNLKLQQSQLQTDEMQRALILSEIAMNRSKPLMGIPHYRGGGRPYSYGGGGSSGGGVLGTAVSNLLGDAEIVLPEVITARPGYPNIESGPPRPGMKPFNVLRGLPPLYLPGDDLQDIDLGGLILGILATGDMYAGQAYLPTFKSGVLKRLPRPAQGQGIRDYFME